MKRTYFCPKCRATLNPNVKVILTVVTPRATGMVLLSPQPGNYSAIIPDELGLREGDQLSFRCPVCHFDLASPRSPKFAEIGFRLSNGVEGIVDFSRRHGEHATFVITDEEVSSYGEHADGYSGLNAFGEGRVELDDRKG